MSISILMFIAGLLFIAASMLDLGWSSVRNAAVSPSGTVTTAE